ncbi:type II secretion system F family protein [Acetobacter fallax]|uniref:Type II secretion system protein GspF domain-containing protein n=1 Tax=Acetobacter fallax TaxID=1737473 RepID=A0ABX0KDS5_9PROT|nr:hypothetical protein [Acetobacter fallax]NHO37216.1 hypothetical protein [Acetobacter fallax]
MFLYIAVVLIVCACFFLVWELDQYLTERRNRLTRVAKICSRVNCRVEDIRQQKTLFSRIFSEIGAKLVRSEVLRNAVGGSALKSGDLQRLGVDIGTFVALKIGFFIVLGMGGYLFSFLTEKHGATILLLTLVSATAGFFLPDIVMRQKAWMHLRRVDAGMADALDLFLVCAEAGLGMETAMERVATEMVSLNKDVAYEFRKTVDELRVNSDRYKVIEDLGKRTGIEALLRLSAALAQTLETGASLGAVLRVLVAEIRSDTLIKFESKAAKLSVLLTFPMILFLLPCMFIVIAGPAIINVIAALSR